MQSSKASRLADISIREPQTTATRLQRLNEQHSSGLRRDDSPPATRFAPCRVQLTELDGFRLLVNVHGDLGSLARRGLEEFHAELESTVLWAPPAVVVDLTDAVHWGASLLGSLVVLQQLFFDRGGQLIVCGDHSGLLRRTRLTRRIPVFATQREALHYAVRITL
jgi:anti-anti-sigma regulatory factor